MSESLQELRFASNEDSLSVRQFSITESLNGLFTIDVIARSPVEDLDLEAFVGHGAAFKLMGDAKFFTEGKARGWAGVCAHMEQIQAEETGLSTYAIRIAPALYRLGLRSGCRIFQRMTIPEIVEKVLGEWEITPKKLLSQKYDRFEFRVQYMETDLQLVSRLLEEAGIHYYFELEATATTLVLSDKLEAGDALDPIPFVEGMTHEGRREFVTKVHSATDLRSGHFTIRDFDFRRKPDYPLYQEERRGVGRETRLERYEYLPGSFWVESSQGPALPMADNKGIYRSEEPHGRKRAEIQLGAARYGRKVVDLETNVVDMAPGKLFSILDHPKKELGPDQKLVVARTTLHGTHAGEYRFTARALYAEGEPLRPPRVTPRPRIYGVQSALVVGPASEEIYTDEYGRVRVQFHWDREHTYDDDSSCWIRVSQGWAGIGYGTIHIPRVGNEVLVEFFDGDPDQPVVVGRVYNATSRVPYPLPDEKTKSGWKSNSSPGSDGFNELYFEDKKGEEEVHLQAERDYSEIVKRDQRSMVLRDRLAEVVRDDTRKIGRDMEAHVGRDEHRFVRNELGHEVLEKRHYITVGKQSWQHLPMVPAPKGWDFDKTPHFPQEWEKPGKMPPMEIKGTGIEIKSKLIRSTTGEASITIDGKDIVLEARGKIIIKCGASMFVTSLEDIFIQAQKKTYINTDDPLPVDPQPIDPPREPLPPGTGGQTLKAMFRPSGKGTTEEPGGFDPASPNAFVSKPPAGASDASELVTITASDADDIATMVAEAGAAPDLASAAIHTATSVATEAGMDLSLSGAQRLDELVPSTGIVVASVLDRPATAEELAKALDLAERFVLWQEPDGSGDVVQRMAIKSQGATSPISSDRLAADVAAAEAGGMTHDRALAEALANQGVVLYEGDGRGNFARESTGP